MMDRFNAWPDKPWTNRSYVKLCAVSLFVSVMYIVVAMGYICGWFAMAKKWFEDRLPKRKTKETVVEQEFHV